MKASNILFAGLFTAVLVGTQSAKADGFICVDQAGTYGIKLYDNVQPSLGTRVPAVMVISSGSQTSGSKTLATFTPSEGNLNFMTGTYHAIANFPSAYNELLGGVKMSQIKELDFSVNHNFNQILQPSQKVSAQLKIQDKNHNSTYVNFTCARYLKN